MKTWLYFLVDDQGRSYKVTNGVVQKVAQPTPLRYTPDGWQELALAYERNMNRYGIVRSFSLPLGFVKEANYILRHIVLTGTVETKVYLVIKKLELDTTVSTYRFIYRLFYKGELDLTTASLGDEKSTVSLLESGITGQIAAKESAMFEYDLATDPEAISIVHDGYPLINKINYDLFDFNTDISQPGIVSNYKFIIPVSFTNREGITGGDVVVSSSTFERLDIVPDLTDNQNYFFRAVPGFEFTLTGNMKFKFDTSVDPGVDRTFTFDLMGSSGATYYTWPATVVTNGLVYEVTFNETINIPSLFANDEAFFIVGYLIVVPNRSTTFYLIESAFDIEFQYVYAPTITKGFTVDVLFRKLCTSITGKSNTAITTFLENYRNIFITCGDAIRGLEKQVLKTSLQDLIRAVNPWLNTGMTVTKNNVTIESKSDIFNSGSTPFHLGAVKNLKINPAADFLCSQIKTGYAEQSYEEALGRFEFNNTAEFTTPVVKSTSILELISPYRTDPTGIEYQRIKYQNTDTTDSPSDNSVFAMNIDYANPNIDDTYNLYRPAYSLIEGVPAESQAGIFNIDLFTPKRILLKHGNWLRSIFYGFEDKRIIFQTTQKNRELRTIESGVVVDEDLNELIGNMASPLFKPYYFEFECESPVGIVDQLDDNPNVLFSFEWEGETYTGFLIKAGIAPDSNKEQTIKLLSSPSNDITQFI
jgi:hypothetical protein